MNETTQADAPSLSLKASEFQQISQLAHQRFGLELKSGKEALVAARLGKQLRDGGFNTFSEYYEHVLADRSGDALIQLIDSLTTNHTSFLRERAHFDFLAQAANEEFREVRRLQIWCAASSTGEEPYSIAMCLADAAGRDKTKRSGFHILATDISTRVLGIANQAVYDGERFRELPEAWKKAFLLRGEGASAGLFKVKPELTRLVEFARLNLIEPFHRGRLFHAIFCRNVMMYFNKLTQQDIVQRMENCLEPGGYLFVGHSESLTGVKHGLKYVRPALYRKEKPHGGLRGWL